MRVFIFILLLTALTPAAYAAGSKHDKASGAPETMPEVIVKGNAVNKSLTVSALESAKMALAKIPGGSSVIDSEDYKKGRSSTLQDALGYTPGVFIQPKFGAEESRLSIRGSGIARTFHLRGIKLLQDGVIPINQADGGGDYQSIDPSGLQYIEVYRGGNALDYGSTTLGGAVNFVSHTGYTAPWLQGRTEAGSFNYFKSQISSGEVAGPVDYYVSLSQFAQKGFRNHSDQDNKRIFSNYGLRVNDHVESRFYVNLVESKSKLPGNLTMAQMKQNPKQNAAANVTINQKRDYDSVQLANKTSFKGNDQAFDIGTFYVHKDLFHPIFQVIDQISHDFGTAFRYLNNKNLFNRKNIFTLGFSPVWNLVETTQHLNPNGDRGALAVKAIQRSYNLDLYAQDQFYVIDKLALVGGMQWTYASRKTTDKFLTDGVHDGNPTYIGLSPKIGVRYELTEHNQLFANFSRSFEPPTFGELSNITGGGIRDLTEQTASTLELGTRGDHGRFSWDAAYYYSWVENELMTLNIGNGATATINAYETNHQGIELGGNVDLLRGIFVDENLEAVSTTSKGFDFREDILGQPEKVSEPDRLVFRGIYNWSRFNFDDDPVFSDNPLPGIPEHFFRFELNYEHPRGFYFGPNVEFANKYAVDMNQTLFTYPYALFGLKGGYRMKNGLSFFIEGRNLTNEIYAATTGIITNAGGADSAQFLPGDGRAIYTGVEFRWG